MTRTTASGQPSALATIIVAQVYAMRHDTNALAIEKSIDDILERCEDAEWCDVTVRGIVTRLIERNDALTTQIIRWQQKETAAVRLRADDGKHLSWIADALEEEQKHG